MTRRSSWATALVLAPMLLTSGCVADGLSFRIDKRVKIVEPKSRSTVTLPVTLSWTVRDFQLKTSPDSSGGSFAVFLDRSPMPPGKQLSWLGRNDSDCTSKPSCPDAAYLAKLGVYTTTTTQLVIKSFPEDTSTSSTDTSQKHDATIVLLDGSGRRIGEIAYNVTFDVSQKG